MGTAKDPNAEIKKIVIRSRMYFVKALTFSAKDVRDPEADGFLAVTDEYW